MARQSGAQLEPAMYQVFRWRLKGYPRDRARVLIDCKIEGARRVVSGYRDNGNWYTEHGEGISEVIAYGYYPAGVGDYRWG